MQNHPKNHPTLIKSKKYCHKITSPIVYGGGLIKLAMKKTNKEHNGALYSSDGKVFIKLVDYKSSYYTVAVGTEAIAENAFAGLSYSNAIDYLDLSESITRLGKGAFQRMALSSIAIPPKVTEIPEKLLFGCTNLEYVHLPEGVESIDREAFWKCPKLTSITLPCSLQEIDGNPFAYTGIKEIDCKSSFFIIRDDCLYTTGGTLIFCFSEKPEFHIPYGTINIGESAFEGNTYIKEVYFPGVVRIASRAFANCTSLTTISVPPNTKHKFYIEKTLYRRIKERKNDK